MFARCVVKKDIFQGRRVLHFEIVRCFTYVSISKSDLTLRNLKKYIPRPRLSPPDLCFFPKHDLEVDRRVILPAEK